MPKNVLFEESWDGGLCKAAEHFEDEACSTLVVLNCVSFLACVASVPVRSQRNSGRAKESFGSRVKNGARAKRWKEGGGGGERRERLPANPSILKTPTGFHG